MQQPMTSATALPVYDYQLVIRPPEHVRKRLDTTRNKIVQSLLPPSNWKPGKNQVPVASFSQYAKNEKKLTDLLHSIASGVPPFLFHVQHYGTALQHTIYFHMVPNHGFNQLLQQLHQEKMSMKVVNQEPRFASFPKINVAFKLQPNEMAQAWQHVKHKRISLRFVADNVLLLRKRPDETKWQILASLPFQNMPVPINQGLLFA
ncbi:MAG TPA: hypothetical protein VLC98_15980 [Phnomibacter sp.]|nr:hypothetical protein [Phnomibacter sp.]